jgi:DNA polymerase-3 subunit epsilon
VGLHPDQRDQVDLPGHPAGPAIDALVATAETVEPGPGPQPASSAEEVAAILRWLESPGIRLVHVDGEWTCPVRGASRHLSAHDSVEQSRLSLVPFDERRSLPTVHQPARDYS